jgi:hypothetical protein
MQFYQAVELWLHEMGIGLFQNPEFRLYDSILKKVVCHANFI